jgi:hypothetical protein
MMMPNFKKHYERVFRSLSRVELQRGMRGLDDLDLGSLFDDDTDLWLGFYTEEGVELALERYGVLDDIRRRGFKKLELELRMDDPDEHMLRIWSKFPRFEEPLLELVASRDVLHFDTDLGVQIGQEYAPVLTVQWLLMQNPKETFDANRLPLPGQNHPGLGVGEQVMEILRNICRRLNLGGLVTIPAHFHNAVMYGVTFNYINPDAEATFRAIERDLLAQLDASLPLASWAVDWRMLVDRNGEKLEPFKWFHEAMVCPIDEPFTSYFESDEYAKAVESKKDAHAFEVFKDALFRNMSGRGLKPFDRAKVDAWLDEMYQ